MPLQFIRHRIIAPVIGMLKKGATPERLAWSLAVGMVIGINPLIGSTTVATLALAWIFRLNIAASQIGTHSMYPFQILLLLPFLHAGTVLFHGTEIPLSGSELLRLARLHPLDLIHRLWLWEWHALIVWAVLAALLTPALALLFTRILERAMPRNRHVDF